MSRFMLATKKSRQPGSMRKRASPVATTLHKMGEFMYTWLPHHRLNAGIIGVGKRLYYQCSKPWLSRSCRLSHRPHLNLILDHSSVWSPSPDLTPGI